MPRTVKKEPPKVPESQPEAKPKNIQKPTEKQNTSGGMSNADFSKLFSK